MLFFQRLFCSLSVFKDLEFFLKFQRLSRTIRTLLLHLSCHHSPLIFNIYSNLMTNTPFFRHILDMRISFTCLFWKCNLVWKFVPSPCSRKLNLCRQGKLAWQYSYFQLLTKCVLWNVHKDLGQLAPRRHKLAAENVLI